MPRAIPTEIAPASSEARAHQDHALRMSRPRSSVPNQCNVDGLSYRPDSLRSDRRARSRRETARQHQGRHHDRSDQRALALEQSAQARASGFSNFMQIRAVDTPMSPRSCSLRPGAWIDEDVGDIGHQVRRDEIVTIHRRDTLHHRMIAIEHHVHDQLDDPGIETCSISTTPRRRTERRTERDRSVSRVAHGVLRGHCVRKGPWRARSERSPAPARAASRCGCAASGSPRSRCPARRRA